MAGHIGPSHYSDSMFIVRLMQNAGAKIFLESDHIHE